MAYILQIQNLSKSFAILKVKGKAGTHDSISVIRDVSMNIERGSVTALIGGNGAGKTTLFNLINGLLKADHGLITFHDAHQGYELTVHKPFEINRLGVGRMFQGPRIFEKLSIIDNLALYQGSYAAEYPFYRVFEWKRLRKEYRFEQELIMEKVKELLGTGHKFYRDWDHPAGSLSYADQRILSLLGLLTGEYRLILIDEPTSGINYEFLDRLKDWISLLKKEFRTVFVIEHNMEFVKDTADVCYYMGAGKIIYSGAPSDVLENAEVQKEYLV